METEWMTTDHGVSLRVFVGGRGMRSGSLHIARFLFA